MELHRDQFIVQYDASIIGLKKLLQVCAETGYPATLTDSAAAETRSAEIEEHELPKFFLEAVEKARAEKKLLVLDFGAKWCVPCQRMEKETLVSPEVSQLLSRCILVKVDADEQPELITEFGVSGVPDIRFLSPDGSELKRIMDYQDSASFALELKQALRQIGN